MKSFKEHIFEKLKVSANSKINDLRDYETVDILSSNVYDKRKFQEYLRDCLERDNYGIQTDNIKFMFNKVIFCADKITKIICDFSVNDTYIELYDRIIDALKENHFIHEKLKVSSKNIKDYNKEYKDKTNKVTYYNSHNYHSYILEVDNIDLFMDYWYHFLESEDDALKENLDLHWDDIYLDYDGQDVYVLDNNTGDEIARSDDENPITFYKTFNRIIEYFEEKNE